MAFLPQTGTSAVITLATIPFIVQDGTMKLEREAIEATPLSFFYKAFLSGRISGTMSLNCFLSAQIPTASTASSEKTAQLAFLSQTVIGTAVAFTYRDSLSVCTYAGFCIVTSYTQTTKGDSAEMVALELQISGIVTA
jgi:hypothetical protein